MLVPVQVFFYRWLSHGVAVNRSTAVRIFELARSGPGHPCRLSHGHGQPECSTGGQFRSLPGSNALRLAGCPRVIGKRRGTPICWIFVDTCRARSQLPDYKVRWKDVAIIALVLAALAFMMCVQAAFWARSYAITRLEALAWWPDGDELTRQRMVHRELRRHLAKYRIWTVRASRSYELGLFVLLAGFGTIFVPPGHISASRWIVISLVGIALAVEFVWKISSALLFGARSDPGKQRLRRIVDRLTP